MGQHVSNEALTTKQHNMKFIHRCFFEFENSSKGFWAEGPPKIALRTFVPSDGLWKSSFQ